MKLPWVSRELLDLSERRRTDAIDSLNARRVSEVGLLDREREDMRSDLARERLRVSALTATILRLKSEGAVLLPRTALTMQPKEPTVFEKALQQNARAMNDPRLHAHLLNYADKQLRTTDRSEDEIAEEIMNWNAVTHDDDEEEGL